MVGGGSVFFALKQINPKATFWINDINKELYLFWKYTKENPKKLVNELKRIKKNFANGKKLYLKFNGEVKNLSEFKRAVRFFLLNRITFSGLAESGGYSKESFKKRFTKSSIERLKNSAPILNKVKITNLDYENVTRKKGKKVFIFLDPPYLSKSKSKLYGCRGCFHKNFDHEKFAKDMKKCRHKWLITYDDSPKIRELFSFAHIYPWELQYGMNNYKQNKALKGKELIITNYSLKNE